MRKLYRCNNKTDFTRNRQNIVLVLVTVMLVALALSACKKNADKIEEASGENTVAENSNSQSDNSNNEKANDNQKDEDDTAGTLQEEPTWEFDSTANFEPWDSEMPFINPMGGQDGYSEVLYSKDGRESFDFVDEENIKQSRNLFGPTWKMIVPYDENKSKEENLEFMKDIKGYVKDIKGVVKGEYDGKLVFEADDSDDVHWWCEVKPTSSSFELLVIKERELKLGETIEIDTADYEHRREYFTSYHDGKTFQSIVTELDEGAVFIEVYKKNKYGDYVRTYKFDEGFDTKKTNYFVSDDAMIDEGVYYWEVTWHKNKPPKKIKISLEESGDIPYVKMGEALGGIKVSTRTADSIEVLPVGQDKLYIDHPEVEEEDYAMDKTPDGDYLVYVPSGLWTVNIKPRGQAMLDSYRTTLVPVNTGEITTIDIPLEYEQLFSGETVDKGVEGLVMENVTELAGGKQVSFDFTLVDNEVKTVQPNKENTEIYEGGKLGEIVSITQVKTPPSVVLLLDSSGSMEGEMNKTIEAAKTFINGLPEDAFIKVVDFDSSVKVLEGENIAGVIKALDGVKAKGSTVLYDAVTEGYKQLEGKGRPTLVVFTDGKDSRDDPNMGKGSEASYEEVLKTVVGRDVSVYTIGFGEGHDGETLIDLAEQSNGLYYSADDDEALNHIFEAINEKIGSTYTAVYNRPSEVSPSDVPVVSFVVDVSGSMDSNFDKTCGWRIDNMKHLLHDFIIGLPDNALLQLTAFNKEVMVAQSSTIDKSRMLRALGELKAGGGTNILDSVEVGYETLNMIPSSSKALIYVTDAALGVEEKEQEKFDTILDEINEKHVNVLWVGLGVDEAEAKFAYAAEKSGGEFIVSEDVGELEEAFGKVMENVYTSGTSDESNIRINVEKVSETGLRVPFSAKQMVELSPLPKAGQVELSESVNYITGGDFAQYDLATAKLLSGSDLQGSEVKILKRMPMDASASSEAMTLRAKELIYMSTLKGIEAPEGYRYLAVLLEAENTLPVQEVVVYPEGSGHPASWVGSGTNNQGTVKNVKIPYMIPDFRSHFYVTYNEEETTPASTATWLANRPLPSPGNHSLTLSPDEVKKGALIFIVPESGMEQCSLHFYDTDYGHIDLPLVGEMKKHQVDITKLPQTPATKLNDAFELAITGYKDTNKVMTEQEANDQSIYRIVEGNFISKVQALIDIDPMDRFLMTFPTNSGSYYIPLNGVTGAVPGGYYGKRMLAPGSFNHARWVFGIPKGLQKNTSNLFIDLKDEDGHSSVNTGSEISGPTLGTYQGEYFDVTINSVSSGYEKVLEKKGNWVIADVTIADKKDGYATRGIGESLVLVKGNYQLDRTAKEEKEKPVYGRKLAHIDNEARHAGLGGFVDATYRDKNVVLPDDINEDLILGIDNETIIYDGTSLRGQMLFELQRNDEPGDWTLQSSLIKDVKVELGEANYDMSLLAFINAYKLADSRFNERLEEGIRKVVAAYRLEHPENNEKLVGSSLLDEEEKADVPAPALTVYGTKVIEDLNSIDDLMAVLNKIEYTPSLNNSITYFRMSSQAVVTQNSGTATDMAHFFYEGLANIGYKPKFKTATLTEKGKEKLTQMSGYDEMTSRYVPVITYRDDNDQEVRIVIPFNKPLKDLGDYVYMEDYDNDEFKVDHMTLEVSFIAEVDNSTVSGQMGSMASALGGGTSDGLKTIEVFSERLFLDELSLDAIDVGVTNFQNKAYVFVNTMERQLISDKALDLLQYNILGIEVSGHIPGGDPFVHRTMLSEDMQADNVFMTMSLNSPNLTDEGAKLLAERNKEVHNKVDNPDEYTALRWYTRRLINDFIYLQSQTEREFEETYDIKANRVETGRGLVVTVVMDEQLKTSMDLLQVENDLHSGDKEAQQSYRLMHGLNAAILEEEVLDNGYGLYSIWQNMPDDGKILVFNSRDTSTTTDENLLDMGMPEDMVEYFRGTYDYIMIQTKPSLMNGEERWAWYEINPKTYETISVLDTGEHGAMSEESIIETEVQMAQTVIGAFKGVETSVWSVSAFSLVLTDYKAILKKAKAFALGVSEDFSVPDAKGMLTDKAKEKAGELGTFAYEDIADTIGFDPEIFKFDFEKPSSKDDFIGFQAGFKAGVEYYFKKASE